MVHRPQHLQENRTSRTLWVLPMDSNSALSFQVAWKLLAQGEVLAVHFRHPLLTEAMVQEDLHVVSFRNVDDLQALAAASLSDQIVARGMARAFVHQHHDWSVRANWLSHVVATVLRGSHYAQEIATFGVNSDLF